MNVLETIKIQAPQPHAGPTVLPGAGPTYSGTDLAASVASARVVRAMEDSRDRQVLFMISELDQEMTCAIARRIKADVPGAVVEVHESLAVDTLPASMINRKKSIGDYRNDSRATGGGAIVFAPPAKEIDHNRPTSDDIQKLSEEALVAKPERWLECAEHLSTLPERAQEHVVNILKGLVDAQILTTGLRMFAAFIERLDDKLDNHPLEAALEHALPALRIPTGAAKFKRYSARGRLTSPRTWAEKFRELQAAADDALFLRRDGNPLDRGLLNTRLDELLRDGSFQEGEIDTLRRLVNDRTIESGQWRISQEEASNVRWTALDRLVKPSKRKLQEPLGQATLMLFSTKMPTVLKAEEKAVLTAMGQDDENVDDEERDFFFHHRSNIAEYSKALLKRWEVFVFRKTEQHSDLALGLFMAIADLVEGAVPPPVSPYVEVRLGGADRQKFWEAHNRELCRFLRDRYRALPEIFERAGVTLDFGMCWTHPWDDRQAVRGSKTAREFKFDILLFDRAVAADDADLAGNGKPRGPKSTTQLIWSMPPESVASSFSENMDEVANCDKEMAFLASGRFCRAQNQERATDGRISLQRRTTFQDASGQPNGVLVNTNDKGMDVGSAFISSLDRLAGSVLPTTDALAIKAAYLKFEASYTEAVRAMVVPGGNGLASQALLRQAVDYGTLLELLRQKARKDECRRMLWQPMLSVGIAFSEGSTPLAICTPWHPFKLAGAAAKALQLARALDQILTKSIDGAAADIRTFSRSVSRSISDGWHPGVALFVTDNRSYLIGETDHFADFGLLESPTKDQGAEDAFDGYSELASDELLAVTDEYLELQPHERGNLSIVLYNANNRSLPSHLATALAAKVEREQDLRCDLILTHSDQRRLRQIYTEQNVAISSRLDGALASEAAQTFLSRLRVGFIDLGGLDQTEQTVQTADIVFLHDVIARAARTSWRQVTEPGKGWPSFQDSAPDTETRRRHFELGARKTESLLVPAERPFEVQQYLNLVYDFHKAPPGEPDRHYVPVREINFDEGGVATIIEQAHKVARWVVTYDAIADQQLFRSNGVKIIRYVPRPDRDHNLVVSTLTPTTTLVSRLTEEVGRILGIGNKQAEPIARKCVDEASGISGRVVLRAARLENNALELLGLVLSKQVIVDSLDQAATPVCWLLLDDFADRLGHKGQKADILVICLSAPDDLPTVDLLVVESKFVCLEGESAAMVESMEQMRASTNDLRDRIVGSGDTLNRPTWLRRLADLLLEQGSFYGPVGGREAQDWARLIREDEARLQITGLSMVFVHDRYDGEAEPLLGVEPEQRQYTFNRKQVADGLRGIAANMTGRP